MIKKYVKSIFNKTGYDIIKVQNINHQIGFNPYYLSKICQPKTVFDVGVGYGTYALYEAFPEAYFILVEPLIEYKMSINEIMKKYNCEAYYQAVGEINSQIEINIDVDGLTKSSFNNRTLLTKTGDRIEKRKVDITTIDSIIKDNSKIVKPIVLKIDTEGHELSVLKGAKSSLQLIDIVIAEVSIAKRFEEVYEFEDIIYFMKENGFYLFSILTIYQEKDELRPRFADVVFKRCNHAI